VGLSLRQINEIGISREIVDSLADERYLIVTDPDIIRLMFPQHLRDFMTQESSINPSLTVAEVAAFTLSAPSLGHVVEQKLLCQYAKKLGIQPEIKKITFRNATTSPGGIVFDKNKHLGLLTKHFFQLTDDSGLDGMYFKPGLKAKKAIQIKWYPCTSVNVEEIRFAAQHDITRWIEGLTAKEVKVDWSGLVVELWVFSLLKEDDIASLQEELEVKIKKKLFVFTVVVKQVADFCELLGVIATSLIRHTYPNLFAQ